ncbi:ribbon-helix-helix protein, CopG family [Altererythrobacter salegens]|uniref:Ribbon-helix-helix protein, CopG family n=1 Tax=Croceibacterium salegens TaxID=1737568 RepID=A0A6I4STS3_9SPHN|nr:ribbon-helix-helix protein, CopG family [Croceibacterium salegens]
MPRILVDLADEDVAWLDRRAAAEGKSRAAVLRDAVAAYRAEVQAGGIERYFGIWQGRSHGEGE